MSDLSIQIAGKKFANPIWLASGTCGYGEELADYFPLSRLGAIVTKTITIEPRPGHPPPRVFETPSGMLNAIGLQNVGVKEFISSKIKFLEEHNANLVVNIAGKSISEYCQLCEQLTGISDIISAIELNMSCPNVSDGMEFSKDAGLAEQLVKTAKKSTHLPLIAKLSPNVSNIVEIAQAAEQGGADAVSMINTLVGMAVDIETFKPRLSNVTGGLSGPAIKPIALAMVYRTYHQIKIPIIGIGGIMNYKEAIEFMLCGAKAVQVGTVNFVNPMASIEILNGMKDWLHEKGYNSPSDIIGKVEA
jgi:dihydroorotate dehydrogenase (NAD+) catalytic subunit